MSDVLKVETRRFLSGFKENNKIRHNAFDEKVILLSHFSDLIKNWMR
jgi:hypothetical protein